MISDKVGRFFFAFSEYIIFNDYEHAIAADQSSNNTQGKK